MVCEFGFGIWMLSFVLCVLEKNMFTVQQDEKYNCSFVLYSQDKYMPELNGDVPHGKAYFKDEILLCHFHYYSYEHLGETAWGPNQITFICIY